MTSEQELALNERNNRTRAEFIREHLSEEDKWVQSRMAALHSELRNAQRGIKEQQILCTHPLIARQTTDRGSRGNWDRGDDCYWTNHECEICGRSWTTTQSWKNTGDRLGLPNTKQGKDS